MVCQEVNLFDLVNNESHTSLHLQMIQIFMLFSQAQLVNYPVIKNLLISSVCPNEINCTLRNTITNNSAWLNIKMLSYQYRKYHCRDKTVTRSSYLHNGISYIGKMASLYWISHLVAKTYKGPFSTWMSKVLVNERMYVCMYITSLINYDLAQSQKNFPRSMGKRRDITSTDIMLTMEFQRCCGNLLSTIYSRPSVLWIHNDIFTSWRPWNGKSTLLEKTSYWGT